MKELNTNETLSILMAQQRANQQSSIDFDYYDKIADYALIRKRVKMEDMLIELGNELRKANIENNKAEIVENLIKYLKLRTEGLNQDLSGCVAGYRFMIDEKRPNFMSISYGPNDSVLTTNGQDVSYEYVEIEANTCDLCNKEKNEIINDFHFEKYTYVVDGKEINEYVELDMRDYRTTSEQAKEVTNYFENELGYTRLKDDYLVKLNVENPTLIQDIAVGDHVWTSDMFAKSQSYTKTGIYVEYTNDVSKNREELLQKANQFKNGALAVYSLVLEAYNKMNYTNISTQELENTGRIK